MKMSSQLKANRGFFAMISNLEKSCLYTMEVIQHCTPERQSLFESRRHRRRLTICS